MLILLRNKTNRLHSNLSDPRSLKQEGTSEVIPLILLPDTTFMEASLPSLGDQPLYERWGKILYFLVSLKRAQSPALTQVLTKSLLLEELDKKWHEGHGVMSSQGGVTLGLAAASFCGLVLLGSLPTLAVVCSGDSGFELPRMAWLCMSVVPKRSERAIVNTFEQHFMYHLLLIIALLLKP